MVFKINFFKTLLTTTLSVFFCISSFAQTNWISPFNGKNLKGWEIKQGAANFEVINNMIVATTLLGSKSTYLATKKQYGDFIFEAEMYATPGLNSGIQLEVMLEKKVFMVISVNLIPTQFVLGQEGFMTNLEEVGFIH